MSYPPPQQRPSGQGQWPQQQYPPQPYQQQYPPDRYAQPAPVPQHAQPRRAVTKRPLGAFETTFHLCMTICTAGLWGPVWWLRVRSRRTITSWE